MKREHITLFCFIMGPCILLGFLMLALAHAQSSKALTDTSTWLQGAQVAWQDVGAAWDTETPPPDADWPDALLEAESMADLGPAEEQIIVANHGFMISCSLFMFLGLLSLTFLGAATPFAQPFWIVLMRNTGIASLVLTAYLFIGFNLSYPWDFAFGSYMESLMLPMLPEHYEPLDYGFMGMTAWGDAYYQAAYPLFFVLILASFCSAGLRTATYGVLAIALGFYVFPIVCSWHWGGGWLSVMGDMGVYDFAGAGLVCLQAGAAAVPIAIGLAISQRRREIVGLPELEPTSKPALFYRLAAAVLLLPLALGWIGGSVLDADAPYVAGVIKVSLASAGAAALIGLVWGFIPGTRRPVELAVLSAMAGLVMTSAGVESVSLKGGLLLGGVAGLFVAPVLAILDRLRVPDPIGAIPVFGICGFLACLVPALNTGSWFLGESTFHVQTTLAVASAAPAFIFTLIIVFAFSVFNYFDRNLEKPQRARTTPPPLPPGAGDPVPAAAGASTASSGIPAPTPSNPNPAPYPNRPPNS